jgi:hypothetical protein
MKKTIYGGNCFFAAVNDQLTVPYDNVQAMREELFNLIMEKLFCDTEEQKQRNLQENGLLVFVDDYLKVTGMDLMTVLDIITTNKEWRDEIWDYLLPIYTNYLKLNVLLYDANGDYKSEKQRFPFN